VDRRLTDDFDHVFYSGPIDEWFRHEEGRLGYRTLDFVTERHQGDYQGNAVINYCNLDVPWTRIAEHKHFTPWETHERTVIFKEFSRACGPCDTPYYPVRLLADDPVLARYVGLARGEANVTFVGRLGTYRYLDMHMAIGEALDVADRFLEVHRRGMPMPAFVVDRLR
jgi:UDP-galactopyranose mutase